MKAIIYISLVFSLLLSLDSCYYDNGDELLGDVVCDTTSYTYNANIQPVIIQFCLDCHKTGNENGGVNLETYDKVKNLALSGDLIRVIRDENGNLAMPKNQPKLSPCTIRIFELWVADGAPNN